MTRPATPIQDLVSGDPATRHASIDWIADEIIDDVWAVRRNARTALGLILGDAEMLDLFLSSDQEERHRAVDWLADQKKQP